EYLLFVLLLAGFLLAFVLTSPHRTLQFRVVVLGALSYCLWGLLHHYRRGDLYPKVILEYFCFAVLTIVMLALLLYS
ncbi:MAG TPA: hypothetical protein VJ179_03290, partial [Patescibacteria group bacterium]|nr:hypothetical protein [Patescibacteria group bacterium]